MVSHRHAPWLAALVIVLVAATPAAACIIKPVAGDDALATYFGNDPFTPNNTAPELQLTGAGSVENTGGVAVFTGNEFTLDLLFLNSPTNTHKPSFSKLLVTAAFEPGGAGFDSIRFYDPDRPWDSVNIPFGSFVSAEGFGIPEGDIRGIGNGAGDFLPLTGSQVAAVDIGVGLLRGGLLPSASLGVEIIGASDESAIRFDVFGLNHSPCTGWNIQGNNPNSGAAGTLTGGGGGGGGGGGSGGGGGDIPTPSLGVVPEPTALLLFGPGALALYIKRRRNRRASKDS